jgi:nicotinamide-nucleotide amidase
MGNIATLAEQAGSALAARGWMLATAESCTGGWVAKAVTDIAGSSTWFDRGFVTYSNDAKQDLLGVAAASLERHGAVSEPVVRAMAEGALARSRARISVAITGIAGPGGGSAEKPVGMVWFAWSVSGGATRVALEHFNGDREAVRAAAVELALRGVLELARGVA